MFGVFQRNALRSRLLALCMMCSLTIGAGTVFSAVGTSVPISATLATAIAADLFPVSLKLNKGNFFLTNPVVLFLENGRVGIRVRFQAFDHRPAEGIALSETGQATFSGIPGYDAATQKILLTDPNMDEVQFDHSNEATRNFLRQINSVWSAQVTNPIRAEIPPHPYMLPFRNNIENISYDGRNIILTLSYQ